MQAYKVIRTHQFYFSPFVVNYGKLQHLLKAKCAIKAMLLTGFLQKPVNEQSWYMLLLLLGTQLQKGTENMQKRS